MICALDESVGVVVFTGAATSLHCGPTLRNSRPHGKHAARSDAGAFAVQRPSIRFRTNHCDDQRYVWVGAANLPWLAISALQAKSFVWPTEINLGIIPARWYAALDTAGLAKKGDGVDTRVKSSTPRLPSQSFGESRCSA